MTDSKIFFATDIHGSDRCLRKFLNAGKFYGVRRDRAWAATSPGKMIVPVVEEATGMYYAPPLRPQAHVDADGLAKLNKFIADAGFYPHPMTPRRCERTGHDPAAVTELFGKLMHETMAGGWN